MDKSLVNVQPKGKLSTDKNQSIVKTETGRSDLKGNSFVFVLESRCFPYIRYAIQRDSPWEWTQKCLDKSRLMIKRFLKEPLPTEKPLNFPRMS